LKPGIVFHDDEVLDSAVLKRNIDNKYAPGSLTAISSAAYFDHTEITGPLSVRVVLRKSWSQFSNTFSGTYMMAPKMLDRDDRGTIHPIGTGPFMFQSWEQGRSLVVTRFPKYWRKDAAGRQLPYLDSIEFRPIIDDQTQAKALQATDVDLALTTSATVAKDLDGSFTVLRDYTSERTFVMLNAADDSPNGPNPFANIHARKALAYATDRETIAASIGDQVESTTQGYRPDSRWGLPNEQTGYYSFDLDKAKAEVEAYKKDTGRPSLAFTLTGIPDLGVSQSMQQLQEEWKQAGIDVTLDTLDQVKYITVVALGEYQAAWWRYYGYPNPDSNVAVNSSASSKPWGQLSVNFSHYHSDQLDQNLDVGRNTDDSHPPVRQLLAQTVDRRGVARQQVITSRRSGRVRLSERASDRDS
jgi:peptide/nickel transport system substrate-binding protein